MVEIPFFSAELLFAALWLLSRILVWVRQKEIHWKREALLFLMYVNLAVVLRFTFFPMSKVNGRVQPLLFDAAAVFPFRVNLVPFVNLLDYNNRRDLLLNVVGNAAMFVPTGIILPILFRRLDRLWKTAAAGALLSLCIELLQLPFSVRASDVDDLILNTLGVVAGYGVYALARRLRRGKRSGT